MHIAELEHNQESHQNKNITVAGVVRATYSNPFPHFLIQDHSATLICRPERTLPLKGAHLEITGQFLLETPENCTVQLAVLKESKRAYVRHQQETCELPGCEMATQAQAA